ncbi:MAG: PadR family transcriptional regulator [Candidatus Dormibacteraceae bacterium]
MSLKFGILGLLSEEPLHGYEIKQRFEDLLGGTWDVNIGQVYSTFQRMERDHLIEPTGDRGDRGRLAYSITDAGRRALTEWLGQPETNPQQLREDVYVKLLLAGRIANGSLDQLLVTHRRACLQQLHDLGGLEKQARQAGRRDVALILKGAILHSEADLKWIEACAEELRNDGSHQQIEHSPAGLEGN